MKSSNKGKNDSDKLSLDVSLREAKDWLRKRLSQGERCPCCTQFCRVYRRCLYSTQGAALLFLYRNFDHTQFVHKSELLAKAKSSWLAGFIGGGDFSKLSYWGLIEEKEKDPAKDARTSGFWRITDRGKAFALGKICLPKYVFIYDGRLLKLSPETVDIHQCLGKRFSYHELMGETP